ncbi:hypothetical protein JXB41_02695 [Candidatus Woesearchaeota archaeon]|nr:hypothetical protein [Candidatus Woesearchaeota archaeon]
MNLDDRIKRYEGDVRQFIEAIEEINPERVHKFVNPDGPADGRVYYFVNDEEGSIHRYGCSGFSYDPDVAIHKISERLSIPEVFGKVEALPGNNGIIRYFLPNLTSVRKDNVGQDDAKKYTRLMHESHESWIDAIASLGRGDIQVRFMQREDSMIIAHAYTNTEFDEDHYVTILDGIGNRTIECTTEELVQRGIPDYNIRDMTKEYETALCVDKGCQVFQQPGFLPVVKNKLDQL